MTLHQQSSSSSLMSSPISELNPVVNSLLGRLIHKQTGVPYASEKFPQDELKEPLKMLNKFSKELDNLRKSRIASYYYSEVMGSYSCLQDLGKKVGVLILFDEFLKTLPKSRPKDLLLYLLLVEETTHLTMPLVEDDLTTELITFLNMSKAYYQLSKEDQQSLNDLAKQYDKANRLKPWLKLLDKSTQETILADGSLKKIETFMQSYEVFVGQKINVQILKKSLENLVRPASTFHVQKKDEKWRIIKRSKEEKITYWKSLGAEFDDKNELGSLVFSVPKDVSARARFLGCSECQILIKFGETDLIGITLEFKGAVRKILEVAKSKEEIMEIDVIFEEKRKVSIPG